MDRWTSSDIYELVNKRYTRFLFYLYVKNSINANSVYSFTFTLIHATHWKSKMQWPVLSSFYLVFEIRIDKVKCNDLFYLRSRVKIP